MIKRYPTHCGDDTCASCVEAGGFIYLAHHAGGFAEQNIAYQMRKTFESMQETLEQAGASLQEIVQINLYLKDIRDLREACDVFAEYFGDQPPARMTLTTDFFDERCLLMMDGVAYKGKAK